MKILGVDPGICGGLAVVEQLEEALAGLHRDVLERVMTQLKELRSARELVESIAAQDWSAVDSGTRSVALHEINNAITRLREQIRLLPIDDALPSERANAFVLIKEHLFPRERRAQPGRISRSMREQELKSWVMK
jgi:hypothetical protein